MSKSKKSSGVKNRQPKLRLVKRSAGLVKRSTDPVALAKKAPAKKAKTRK